MKFRYFLKLTLIIGAVQIVTLIFYLDGMQKGYPGFIHHGQAKFVSYFALPALWAAFAVDWIIRKLNKDK